MDRAQALTVHRPCGGCLATTGFAFGGVHPGTLHAHGKLFEAHKVSYSIAIAGEYLLHVRLHQQAVSLPGSPFNLKVCC